MLARFLALAAPLRRSSPLVGCVALCLALLLGGCGGGGGGGSAAAVAAPPTPPPASAPASAPSAGPTTYALATIVADTYPTTGRIDVSMRDLMPLHAGDRAVYLKSVASAASAPLTTVTREIAPAPDAAGNLVLTETDGAATAVERYRATADGLVLVDPLGAQAALAGAYDALPSMVLYPLPFYQPGTIVIHVRQGPLNVDVDGDGQADYFYASVSQTFVGFETMTLFGVNTQVAHFRNQVQFETQSVATGARKTVARIDSHVWLADGIGPVRITRSATLDGVVQAPFALDLQSATIGGVQYPIVGNPTPGGIALPHEFLVYDASRRVFYASVSSTSPQANRIATIDATTGAVSYSAAVGSLPRALAISSDYASLWVALDGSGDVVRLALPAMTEVARVKLPSYPFDGQSFAEELAASPTAANAVAVSTYFKNRSPRYAGVGLIRADALQPTMSQNFLGGNSIGFDAGGTVLFGYDNEVTEFGLHRFDVSANGIVQRDMIQADAAFYSKLRVADGLIVISSKVFRASDLSLVATLAGGADCVKVPGASRIACHTDNINDPTKLVIFDSATFAPITTVAYATSANYIPYSRWRLVPGLPGQIAVSETDRVVLHVDNALR